MCPEIIESTPWLSISKWRDGYMENLKKQLTCQWSIHYHDGRWWSLSKYVLDAVHFMRKQMMLMLWMRHLPIMFGRISNQRVFKKSFRVRWKYKFNGAVRVSGKWDKQSIVDKGGLPWSKCLSWPFIVKRK
jgi:hypothetical protein